MSHLCMLRPLILTLCSPTMAKRFFGTRSVYQTLPKAAAFKAHFRSGNTSKNKHLQEGVRLRRPVTWAFTRKMFFHEHAPTFFMVKTRPNWQGIHVNAANFHIPGKCYISDERQLDRFSVRSFGPISLAPISGTGRLEVVNNS